MDGIEELKGVLVLAATNRLDVLDPAIIRSGRFDLLLELPKPDEQTRQSIFKVHTKGKPLAADVTFAELAAKTNNMVGSDIEFICRKAAMLAIREHIGKETERNVKEHNVKVKGFQIFKRHFDEALSLVAAQLLKTQTHG